MSLKERLSSLSDRPRQIAENIKNNLFGITSGIPWPQTEYQAGLNILHPNYRTKGFLPPTQIDVGDTSDLNPYKIGQYEFVDWRGQQLNLNTTTITDTTDRFNTSKTLPKSKTDLANDRYSTRDMYTIFGDTSQDYFRHGLQVIDGLTPIENPLNGSTNLRADSFQGTPFENEDPVIFGFEIVMDDISSPLLNGSVLDFLRNYRTVSEIASRLPVYEDFKEQFVKLFKTKATVDIGSDLPGEDPSGISKMRQGDPDSNIQGKNLSMSGKKAYRSYYLKSVEGLHNLIERNTPETKTFLNDYNKDKITLSFTEDVTLTLGTLAHLYKLLYWSKPNGKTIVPENLLRFNCDIIISEVRNYKRVIKAIDSGDLEVVKDNLSRHVYSLKECQFYFDKPAHDDKVDLSNIKVYDDFQVQFDYKYASSKFERFVPDFDNGFGKYVGYDAGAIWKLGNPGERGFRSGGEAGDFSVPKFFTKSENKFSENGVLSPFVTSIPRDNLLQRNFDIPEEDESVPQSNLDTFKQAAKQRANQLGQNIKRVAINSAQREVQNFINTRFAILNNTLRKIEESSGVSQIRPPRNIYTEESLNSTQRIFYDIRGEVFNFAGNQIGGLLGGGISRPSTPTGF